MRRAALLLGLLLGGAALAGPAGEAAAPDSLGTAPPDTLVAALSVPRSVAKLGEPLRVRVAVPAPSADAHLSGPPAPAALGDLDLRGSEAVPAGPDSAAWLLELAFFRTGDVELPPLPFTLQTSGGGEPVPVRAGPYRFSIVSTLPDTASAADIRDIKGPIAPPRRWDRGRILGALAVLALLAAALILWRRRRRPEEEAAPAVPPVPPQTVALRALRKLEEDALPARGKFEEHYLRLSYILRRYVEDRFGLPALESTTSEIEEELRRQRRGVEEADELLRILEESDLVKFAKLKPGVDPAAAGLRAARAWVERNAPRVRTGEAA